MKYGIRFHALEFLECVDNGTFQKKFSTLPPAPSLLMHGRRRGGIGGRRQA